MKGKQRIPTIYANRPTTPPVEDDQPLDDRGMQAQGVTTLLTCAGCGHPVDYELGREPVSDGRTLWHFKCYLTAPDPERPTTNYTLVSGRPVTARDPADEKHVEPSPSFADMEAMIAADPKLSAYVQDMTKAISVPPHAGKMTTYDRLRDQHATVDRPRMIRWLKGKIAGWEKLEASAESRRLRRQAAWQLLHARAILAVLRGLA